MFKPSLLEYYQIKFDRHGSSLSNELKSTSKDISNEINNCYANEEKLSISTMLIYRGRLELYEGVEIFMKVFKMRG